MRLSEKMRKAIVLFMGVILLVIILILGSFGMNTTRTTQNMVFYDNQIQYINCVNCGAHVLEWWPITDNGEQYYICSKCYDKREG